MKNLLIRFIPIFLYCFEVNAQIPFSLSSSPIIGNGTPGNNTSSVASGDVNNDNSTDLISANYSANTLTVITNNGQGEFILAGNYSVGEGPSCVIAADINNDRSLDLISANMLDSTISVLTNNGNGHFALSETHLVGNGPGWVTAADINGDGYLDLISANYYDSSITILTNNGNGHFSLQNTYSVGGGPACVTALDIKGIGKLDLVTANWGGGGGNTLTVLTNSGDGIFALAFTLTVGNGTRSVTAADINGDGKPDLISGDFSANRITIFTNDNKGGFLPFGTNSVGDGPSSIGTGDFDGDGTIDLFFPNRNANSISVLTNNGSGIFGPAGTYSVGNHPYNATAADINGDGKLDLITANSYSSDLSVLTNGTKFIGKIMVSTQPVSTTNILGDNVSFFVGSTNKVPLKFQWFFNNSLITNATNSFLTIYNLQQTNLGDYFAVISSSSYNIQSTKSILASIFEMATITGQPTNLVANSQSSATFTVSAVGYPAINSYQWFLNGTNLPGANSNSITIIHPSLQNSGNYQVLVSNSISSATSSIATLNISPTLVVPFIGATPIWGRTATFSVGAIGNGTLTYQWYLNGLPIAGANSPALTFPSIQFTNNGFYSVVVTSPYGTVTNVPAQVAIDPAVVTLGFSPTLTINGAAGDSYIIQRSSDLTNTNNWKTLTSITLFQPSQIWVDTSVDAISPFNNHFFYQLIPLY